MEFNGLHAIWSNLRNSYPNCTGQEGCYFNKLLYSRTLYTIKSCITYRTLSFIDRDAVWRYFTQPRMGSAVERNPPPTGTVEEWLQELCSWKMESRSLYTRISTYCTRVWRVHRNARSGGVLLVQVHHSWRPCGRLSNCQHHMLFCIQQLWS